MFHMEAFLNCHFVHRTVNAPKIDPTEPEKLGILFYTVQSSQRYKKKGKLFSLLLTVSK